VNKDYWSLSGSSQLIVKRVSETGEMLLGPRDITVKALEQPEALESIPLQTLMYFGGYLTIKSYNHQTGVIQLDVPNSMIRDALSTDMLMSIFKTEEILTTSKVLAAKIASLMKLEMFSENDSNQLKEWLNQLYANVPYDLLQSEAAFRNVLDTLFCMEFTDVRRETHTSRGRSDTIICYADIQGSLRKIFILEYKFDKKNKAIIAPDSTDAGSRSRKKGGASKITVESAIDQIQNKGYDEALRMYNVPIISIGISCSSEKRISVVVNKLYE
jgi:hypothetical protein